MKEATGELNMTVITVVAIAAVAAFFYAFVWPAIRNVLIQTTNCNSASCVSCTINGNKRVCEGCTYVKEDGTESEPFKCTYTEKQDAAAGGAGGGGS